MKQVLFISAGKGFPEGAFTFMASNKQFNTFHVKGLFFSPFDFDDRISAGYIPEPSAFEKTRDIERKKVQEHKEHFARRMKELDMPFSIHSNDEPWDKLLFIKETRFADTVVVSGESFYAELEATQPNSFLREALRETECPILVLPETFTPVTNIAIAYDGSRESIHAFKQFTYLFPYLTGLPAEVIYAKHEESDAAPDKELLGVYAHLHYSDIHFSKLHFKMSESFPAWLGEKQGTLLIAGSFGRGTLSYMAKKSFAEKIIFEHKVPMFITHF